ncbi:hypothetical protein [Catellatospora sichuanensis]|uniref:hypothetical protein n=1 Tax=Catellatospora sichuanensis TaxID=1969805 RepID=UPI001183EBB7|nr:hypothetical protein [Catellatospora sichuanensis]
MRHLIPLVVVAALLAGGCGPAAPVAAPTPPSSPVASPTPSAPGAPSPAASLTPIQLMETAMVSDELLTTVVNSGGLEVVRASDRDSWPGFPVGIVTACGERSASSTADAKRVLTHVRSWTIGQAGIVGQDVFVLPKEQAKDVVAKVEPILKGCKSYREAGVTFRKIESTKISVDSALYHGAAACYSDQSTKQVVCYTYFGRGRVVILVNTYGPDQESTELLTTQVKSAVESRLTQLPG